MIRFYLVSLLFFGVYLVIVRSFDNNNKIDALNEIRRLKMKLYRVKRSTPPSTTWITYLTSSFTSEYVFLFVSYYDNRQ